MRAYAAVILILIFAVPLSAGPDAQKSLCSVANIARLALGCSSMPCETNGPAWVLGPPPATYFDGGTPNQKMLVRVWHYGWALRVHSSELDTARTTLLDFINRQHQQQPGSGGPWGHYAISLGGNEELTSSHYQLWSGALAAAYLYAITNGGTLTTNSDSTTPEVAVRDAVRRWWADERALYDRIHTNGQIDAPGTRFDTTAWFGPNPLRDDIYHLLKGENPVKARSCTSNKYYTSSFVMQALKSKGVTPLGQPPAGFTADAKLYDTLCVYRNSTTGEWTVYFPVMRSVTEPLYWVEFRNGVKSYAGLPPNPIGKPQSYAFGVASVDPIWGVVAGAAQCPQPHLLDQ